MDNEDLRAEHEEISQQIVALECRLKMLKKRAVEIECELSPFAKWLHEEFEFVENLKGIGEMCHDKRTNRRN